MEEQKGLQVEYKNVIEALGRKLAAANVQAAFDEEAKAVLIKENKRLQGVIAELNEMDAE